MTDDLTPPHWNGDDIDAVFERMQSHNDVPVSVIADAITALRAQLARREEMHDCAMKERDDATIYADEQKARADRAEAALAAQIEADAGIAAARAFYTREAVGSASISAMVANVISVSQTRTAYAIEDAIRNQPHDRTTLDRVKAEVWAKAIREAADRTLGLATGHECRKAILALLDKEGA